MGSDPGAFPEFFSKGDFYDSGHGLRRFSGMGKYSWNWPGNSFRKIPFLMTQNYEIWKEFPGFAYMDYGSKYTVKILATLQNDSHGIESENQHHSRYVCIHISYYLISLEFFYKSV